MLSLMMGTLSERQGHVALTIGNLADRQGHAVTDDRYTFRETRSCCIDNR